MFARADSMVSTQNPTLSFSSWCAPESQIVADDDDATANSSSEEECQSLFAKLLESQRDTSKSVIFGLSQASDRQDTKKKKPSVTKRHGPSIAKKKREISKPKRVAVAKQVPQQTPLLKDTPAHLLVPQV